MAAISYGIVFQYLNTFIIVNERPGDHVDLVMVIDRPYPTVDESNVTVQSYQDIDIKSLLFDDGHPYATYRMEFTTDHGSVAAARYMDVDGRDLALHVGQNNKSAMRIAEFVLWYESLRASGFSQAKNFEHSVKISGWSREKKDDEICVICLKEYRVDEMIGTLACKHGYHQECIIKWLLQKSACPICRATVYNYTL